MATTAKRKNPARDFLPKSTPEGEAYLVGVVWSAWRAYLDEGPNVGASILAQSGGSRNTLHMIANEIDGVVLDEMEGLISHAYEEFSMEGYVDGNRVTHAHGTGDGWALFHYDGDKDRPPADEMTPLYGWPSSWPPWTNSQWLREVADVEVV